MLSKKLLIIPVTGTILVAGLLGTTSVLAAANTDGQYPSIVQKLAEKFGLNANDVKAVFDADRQDRQTNQEKRFIESLDAAIKAGKLTEAQKQLIITKRSELKASHVANRTALMAWAKDNGIDIKYLMFMRGRHGGMGKPMGPPTN